MKTWILLILLLFGLAWFLVPWGHSLVVTIVMPPSLMPYYDWLLAFPGWAPVHSKPPLLFPLKVGFRSVTPGGEQVTFPAPGLNNPGLSCWHDQL